MNPKHNSIAQGRDLPVITVDHRERQSGLIELLHEKFTVEVKHLLCGDYLTSNVTVERKTARDFLMSIIDGRLFTQAAKLKKRCTRPVFLVEGDLSISEPAVSQESVKGALLSLQVAWQIPVLFTESPEDSVNTLHIISRQIRKTDDHFLLRHGYRPKRLKNRQLYILQGLPEVGPALARRLLEHFGSVRVVMNATEEELAAVRGIGRRTAARVVGALT